MKWSLLICCLWSLVGHGQTLQTKPTFSRYDTLRGSITPGRVGWDVRHYEITVQPDIESHTIKGQTIITYFENLAVRTMQIDLQQPLIVDSIVGNHISYTFKRDSNFCFVNIRDSLAKYKIKPGLRKLTVYYHGTPTEAKKAPWDGGVIWQKDSLGRPFIATACQGKGASVWWPCKDHQSDEPDNGVKVHLIVADSLTAISNGRLLNKTAMGNNLTKWTWQVTKPINTYDVTMNIGNYISWSDTMRGEGGTLDLQYWVLDYSKDSAMKQFAQVKPMLRSHEYWFGKYPFYEDGYKLVETPFLGMEHQSGIAYGNKFQNGYLGRDRSKTGWGMKWDFIIVHESAHEWFGNSITANDIADMWIHEGFTNYSEVLYVEQMWGKAAGQEYCYGLRNGVKNDEPVIGIYGVNNQGSGDMYNKASNMINTIRNVMNDDVKFRTLLRRINIDFFHQTVTSKQLERYISKQTGIDFSKIFDQYLRTTKIPILAYFYDQNLRKMSYRWTNCVKGFSLPVHSRIKLKNAADEDESILKGKNNFNVERSYFIQVKKGNKSSSAK